jgi:hypothetical protein
MSIFSKAWGLCPASAGDLQPSWSEYKVLEASPAPWHLQKTLRATGRSKLSRASEHSGLRLRPAPCLLRDYIERTVVSTSATCLSRKTILTTVFWGITALKAKEFLLYYFAKFVGNYSTKFFNISDILIHIFNKGGLLQASDQYIIEILPSILNSNI